MSRRQSTTLLVGSVLAFGEIATGAMAFEPTVDFSRDVRPILSDNCFKCHGPDTSARKASLRLDRLDEAAHVLSREAPDESELLFRITVEDAEFRMPPAASKQSLTLQEIETLRRWIAAGAPQEQRWPFSPLEATPIPQVQNIDWPKTEIDYFILERLEEEGLAPAGEASREKLIRRLSFDLTGLPPALETIDAFLEDDSPGAYERLVDRLLAKPQFGERMASDWLDTARYSDSYGYQVDRERFVWPWRDWVIGAFNGNLPYDDFITWQLAGDLLPGATREQILATTFNRLHPQKVEGGSVPEEFRVEYVADRTHTFATAFLGLTLECARCHDHKYDPVSQKEYYQLFAFFNNLDEAGLYSYMTQSVPTPTLRLTEPETQEKLARLAREIEVHERGLTHLAQKKRELFERWLESRPAEAAVPGRIAHLDFEDLGESPHQGVPGKVGQAVELNGDDAVLLDVGNFRRFEPFSVVLWMQTPDVKQRAVVFHRSRAWTDAGSRGYQLLVEDGKLSASLIHFWPGNAMRIRTREPLPTHQWIHVAVTYDGSSRAEGLSLYLDGQRAASEVVRDHLHKNITGGGGDNLAIGARFRDRGFTDGRVDEFQVFNRQLSEVEVAQLHDGTALVSRIQKPMEELSADEEAGLHRYFLSAVDPEYRARLDQLKDVRKAYCELADGVQEIMVMGERSPRRPTYLLTRGAYNAPGEPVEANTPAVLPPFPKDATANRLGLARWLTRPDHPLTARVAVNHFWQMVFGRGLVRTPEDFGSQGTPPTHPELLDWLARDFLEHDWDVKRLMKKLVLSSTYRQTTDAPARLRERDPENLLLARAPSYRLPAEMIRDGALAAAGALRDEVGGPPVRPYEVAVSFKPLERDQGAGLYRRSLYTFWKRTAPAPVMMTLDAAKRDVCRVRREQTSSPLQSLVLLNDPQLVEAARLLGQQLLRKHPHDATAMIQEMFRTLTSRRATDAELAILQQLYEEQIEYFNEDATRVEGYLKTGDSPLDDNLSATDLAAASVVAQALMNFDECVMKR